MCGPIDAALWLCPCLNPTGFPLNRRENAEGIDLNRDYRHLQSAEVRAHIDWLGRQPFFDLTLCLHEDLGIERILYVRSQSHWAVLLLPKK